MEVQRAVAEKRDKRGPQRIEAIRVSDEGVIPHHIPIKCLILCGYIFLSLTGYTVELKTVIYHHHHYYCILCLCSLAFNLVPLGPGVFVDQFFVQ